MRNLEFSGNLALGIVGAVLVTAGVLAMRVELSPYLSAGGSMQWRLQEIAAGRMEYGLSTASREVALMDCRDITLSFEARLQPSSTRTAIYGNCLALSDSFSTIQPTLAIAWLTGAIAAAQTGDWAAFASRMTRSLRAARNEQWVAEMRIPVFEQYFDQLNDELVAGNAADMLLLTDTDPGLLRLARIFVASPSSRDRIEAVINTRSDVTRAKFERRVRLVTEGSV